MPLKVATQPAKSNSSSLSTYTIACFIRKSALVAVDSISFHGLLFVHHERGIGITRQRLGVRQSTVAFTLPIGIRRAKSLKIPQVGTS
jgi:hypothetical protein